LVAHVRAWVVSDALAEHNEQSEVLFGDEHVKRYRETDGEVGHDWLNDSTVLILTTKGRRSGEPRHMPLIYRPYNGAHLVVASKGGWDKPPAWYLNLEENPEVEVQIKGDRFRARARTATPEEKPDMWRTMTAMWPDYDDYQASTEREIPVVVLERV
jgi:deazaflavin-dependent oxidoreductase (nitroreductase family)